MPGRNSLLPHTVPSLWDCVQLVCPVNSFIKWNRWWYPVFSLKVCWYVIQDSLRLFSDRFILFLAASPGLQFEPSSCAQAHTGHCSRVGKRQLLGKPSLANERMKGQEHCTRAPKFWVSSCYDWGQITVHLLDVPSCIKWGYWSDGEFKGHIPRHLPVDAWNLALYGT